MKPPTLPDPVFDVLTFEAIQRAEYNRIASLTLPVASLRALRATIRAFELGLLEERGEA